MHLMNNDMWNLVVADLPSLDDIVNLLLSNPGLSSEYVPPLDQIKKQLGITRPLIDTQLCTITQFAQYKNTPPYTTPWDDLIRENSKIHATRYTTVTGNHSDRPSDSQLLTNAIREDRLDLVELYFPHFTPQHLNDCTSPMMFRALIYESNATHRPYIPNQTINHVRLQPQLINDNQFNGEMFRFYVDEVAPVIHDNFFIVSKGHRFTISLSLDIAIENAIIYDYPLPILWQVNPYQVGPNNLHLLPENRYYLLIFNPIPTWCWN